MNSGKKHTLNLIKEGFACIEVGVWKGEFSTQILTKNPNRLYLVDPWAFIPKYTDRWYGGDLAKSQEDMDKIFKEVVDKFENDQRVEILRGYSKEEIKKINNLDWSYIDGNHSYEFVLEDIKLLYEKIKKGGFVCGDDMQKPGVYNAVTDFSKEIFLEPTIIENHFVFTKMED